MDARLPVGRRFPIVVPYSWHLTESFVFMSIYKRGVDHIYRQSRGHGPRKTFSGPAPDPILLRPSYKKMWRRHCCRSVWRRSIEEPGGTRGTCPQGFAINKEVPLLFLEDAPIFLRKSALEALCPPSLRCFLRPCYEEVVLLRSTPLFEAQNP